MMRHLFPDNTVLCNYACVERIDLLELLVAGNGGWTQAVKYEVGKSTNVWPALQQISDNNILGEAIEVTDADMVQRIRIARLGGDKNKPLQHLGEAETVYLLQHSAVYKDSIWITDDRDAYDFGMQQGLITKDTVETLQMLMANGELTRDEAFSLLVQMQDSGRNFRWLPASKHEL